MHDIMTPLRYAAGSIDMVHARSITMAVGASPRTSGRPLNPGMQVRDYRVVIQEASRVLRRGGLFVSCEWAPAPAMEDDSDVRVRAPSACALFDAVRETLRVRRGLECIETLIPQLLVESRRFDSVETRVFRVPIGDWPNEPDRKELGRDLRELMVLYARSVFPLLSEGPSARYASALVEDYIREIRSVSGMIATYHTVYARRV